MFYHRSRRFLWTLTRFRTETIRAVAEQRSSPELRHANKTKMYLKQKKKKKKKKEPSKPLEYEDLLYFDLQSHPMAYTLGSVVMEWKQTLQSSYIWKMNVFWWLPDAI